MLNKSPQGRLDISAATRTNFALGRRKKYFIFAAVLFLAASCLKQQVSVTPSPNPTPPSDPTATWQTYRNGNYNFEFKYPDYFVFEQPTGYFLSNPIAQLETSRKDYPGTNYAESIFALSTTFAKTEADCYKDPRAANKTFSEKTVINGITFYKGHATDAGAGNFYNSDIYRTVNQGTCIELSLTIHTTNVGNYPEEEHIAELDQSKPMAVLLQMLNTYKFNQANQVSDKLKVCPQQWWEDDMPTAGNQTPAQDRQYYILDGKRRELSEFDATWVKQNCAITLQHAS